MFIHSIITIVIHKKNAVVDIQDVSLDYLIDNVFTFSVINDSMKFSQQEKYVYLLKGRDVDWYSL